MASSTSPLATLRDNLLGDGAFEEKVEVNQRHLIDKILARYSAENTIFRELLQNSNDAGASAVEIHFKTGPTPQKSNQFFANTFFFKKSTPNVTSILYKNNGRPFLNEDWNRLRKIAEGNPDEQKIGFFGVGFYSLFSICDEPFVSSGAECMAFFWRGDQLFTKKSVVKEADASPLTTFYLSLREPIETPNITEFSRFLATSLAFTSQLKKVEVFIDDHRVIMLEKKASAPRPLEFPKGHYQLKSPNSLFELTTINMHKVQLDLTAFFDYEREKNNKSSSFTTSSLTVFMRTATATCTVRLPAQLTKEMERTTKKNPPSVTTMHALFANYDEYDSSQSADKNFGVFKDLIPGPKDQGKIFIGFPTHQTTGCTMQLAAHLIPTVERESIDFVDRTLNIWNQDLLTMGGLLGRIVYEDEMSQIGQLRSELTLDDQSKLWISKKAAHVMCAFTFRLSTPAAIVGKIHKAYFNKLCTKPLSIMSSKGVLPVTEVRLPKASMKSFIKEIPTIPQELVEVCAELIQDLHASQQLREISFQDVLVEVDKRVFEVAELVDFIRWWIDYRRENVVSNLEVRKLLETLIVPNQAVIVGGNATGTTGSDHLRAIEVLYYLNSRVIPPNVPVPKQCLNLEVSKSFSGADLELAFGSIRELSIVEWLIFVVKLDDFKKSPAFVENVLTVVNRQYGSLRKESQLKVIEILSAEKCIVTKSGLHRPGDSYFKNVTLFEDLPIANFENPRGISDSFLRALGVREHVELQLIFSRLQDLNWDSDHYQLVKYLASVRDKLTEVELNRLKLTSVFTSEESNEAGKIAGPTQPKKRFKAKELYAPLDSLRAFGLPLLQWPKSKWVKSSDEAKFMISLGLRTVIPYVDLIDMAASADEVKRGLLLDYFVENWKVYMAAGYDPSVVRVPFLPSSSVLPTLCVPSQVYSDPEAAIMEFAVIAPALRPNADKFGVREHPPGSRLVQRLKANPPTTENAENVFSYLSGRQSSFTSAEWQALAHLNFIPIVDEKTKQTKWVAPSAAYFASSNSSFSSFGQFNFIDFGVRSNAFLRACGVKDEPSPAEIAKQVVMSPNVFLEQMGHEKYLQLLRTIAANFQDLQRLPVFNDMKRSKFLIGIRVEKGDHQADHGDDGKDREETVHYHLADASSICLLDDPVLGQLFTPLTAPMERLLEDMYFELGSTWLSKQVVERILPNGQPKQTEQSFKLQTLIHERALLLMYDGQQIRGGSNINPAAESVLKTLDVYEVPSIMIERSFRQVTKSVKTTSCLMVDKSKQRYFLYISGREGEFDYFDVASALGKLIFRKCRLNDSLLLSTLLSTSLTNLQRKGFPVERILSLQEEKIKKAKMAAEQAKALERENSAAAAQGEREIAKQPNSKIESNSSFESNLKQLVDIFPQVDRNLLRKMLEEEENSDKPLERVTDRALGLQAKDSGSPGQEKRPKPLSPPGSWPSNDDVSSDRQLQKSSTSGTAESPMIDPTIYNKLNQMASSWLGEMWSGGSSKPPESGQNAQRPNSSAPQHTQSFSTDGPGSSSIPGNMGRIESSETSRKMEEISPVFTDLLKEQLAGGVSAVKPSKDSMVKATIQPEPPAPVVPHRHATQSCEPISESDLTLYGNISGLPFYLDSKHHREARRVAETNQAGLFKFSKILTLLATIFGIDPKAMNIYWDKEGATVAFNRGRTLFFNARFYLGLHYQGGSTSDIEIGKYDVDGVYYWFMVACHELAHNFVQEHNSNHEFYFSSFAEVYLSKLVRSLHARNICAV
ncbi:hypothetical protein HDU76_006583 [Blyttiomyces sp. JEL0837]|nr:hypothetical protein HDU76_006583 [Blyttiomyces sp. JEL0837]